jgi:nucleoside-diphosphate-sugar epimerase
VVTGATGLLGSHLVNLLVERGESVRALVRPDSDTRYLDRLGVDKRVGNLDEPRSLLEAVDGADLVFHCAARVGDWGPWELYFRQVVVSTVNLLKACEVAAVGRVIHTSSINVYGHLKERESLFTEAEPLGQNLWWWDHYCRAKIMAEQRVQIYPGDWTIIRPSWIYGPRDRNTLPRVIEALRARAVPMIGSGENKLNLIFAEDVASALYKAAIYPDAANQAYNIASSGEITQRDLLNVLTDELGLQRIKKRVSFPLAFWAGFFSEAWGRFWKREKPPRLTRYAVALLGRSTRFSTEKARSQLSWSPQVEIREGVRRTLSWYHERELERAAT